MKILTAKQIRELERFTMELENISSIDLMERVAHACLRYIPVIDGSYDAKPVYICGKGNNGGDGLAMARLEATRGTAVMVVILEHTKQGSAEFGNNLYRLQEQEKVEIIHVRDISQMPEIPENSIVIDAILGTGLSRPIEKGLLLDAVQWLNSLDNHIFSIDIPTGLFAEDNTGNNLENVVKASMTVSIHGPKMSFLNPLTGRFTGRLQVVDIGLASDKMGVQSPYEFVIATELRKLYRPREKFSHKGTFGHALILAGSKGKMGAAQLTTMGALRIGAGLVTAHVPSCGLDIMQVGVMEAMCSVDSANDRITDLPDLSPFNAIAIGPGIGTDKDTANVVERLLQNADTQLVLDADALNILGMNKTWLSFLPKGTILTPHLKEFERMVGPSTSFEDQLNRQTEFSKKYGVIVVLKGAHTCTTTPSGQIFFNSSGDPGMATAGSGDVLTGIIVGLVAQGYSPEVAAIMGVFMHGAAGQYAMNYPMGNNMIASSLLHHLPNAFELMNIKHGFPKYLSFDNEEFGFDGDEDDEF
jgi:hydroxyethylthiazole kinase-like uncharacterized protein yjeF